MPHDLIPGARRRATPVLAAAAAALLALASPAFAFDAVVATCHDGDTCTVVASEQRIHIRLHGVDVRPAGHSHDRLVADMVREDGLDTATEMVASGAAWVEPRFRRSGRR